MEIVAAVCRSAGGDFTIEKVQLDEPRDDELIVAIAGVGLCHTDLVAQDNGFGFPFPAVFGHEGSGIVDKVGANVTKVQPGDRVAITFRSCGTCSRCLRGDAPYCETMPLLNYIGCRPDGSRAIRSADEELSSNFFGQSSFATHALTYERNVVKLPDDIPLELMGPLGCGVQTGAGSIMRSLACEPGSTLVVAGGGSVGLSAVMGAKIQGCATVIVLEPFANRRALALELGATHAIDSSEVDDLTASIREIVPLGVDYAFDTTGRLDTLEALMASLATRGVLGFVGVPPVEATPPGNLRTIMTFGHTIRGIIEGDSDPDSFLPELVEHYRAGRLPIDRLIQTYPLEAINDAIADQHAGKCIKAVLLVASSLQSAVSSPAAPYPTA